jgi:transcriptional regulator with XRE-family HTH domain
MLQVPEPAKARRLIALSRQALEVTQNQLATLMRVARRTVGRWEGRGGSPSVKQLADLARMVHPKDLALATELATEAGTTLAALGLEEPAAPPAPAALAAPQTPARIFPPVGLMTDSILHVAKQALEEAVGNTSDVATVLAVLRAGFARARGLGLTIAEVDDAFSPKSDPVSSPPGAGEKNRARRR